MGDTVATLAQSGGIGVALAALWLIYRLMITNKETMEGMTKTMEGMSKEHMAASREHAGASRLMAEALIGNTEVIRSLRETIDRKL